MPPPDVLQDLCSRFILNCPAEELQSFERLLFLVEQARRGGASADATWSGCLHAGFVSRAPSRRHTGFMRTFAAPHKGGRCARLACVSLQC